MIQKLRKQTVNKEEAEEHMLIFVGLLTYLVGEMTGLHRNM